MRPEQPQRERLTAYANTLRERFDRGVLAELQPLSQWVVWKREYIGDQWKKVPYNPRGFHASVNNPRTWGSLSDTLKILETSIYDGIGFMLSEADPYCFVDIDHCYDRSTHQITNPLASRLVSHLASYTEASPNDGLHILVRARLPGKGIHSAIELYDRGRFFTVTTRHVPQTPITVEQRQQEIEALYQAYKPVIPSKRVESTRVGGGEVRTTLAGRSDEEVLQHAMSAPNAQRFLELWEGRWQGNHRYIAQGKADESKADWQLVKYLLYWTGNDATQTDRLFRQSALMRHKWDDSVNSGGSGYTYGQITIHNAMK